MKRRRLQELTAQARLKPFRTWIAIMAVMVGVRILGEFTAGVIDGLVVGFTDAV